MNAHIPDTELSVPFEIGIWVITLILVFSTLGKLFNFFSFCQNLEKEFAWSPMFAILGTALLILIEGILGVMMICNVAFMSSVLWATLLLFVFFLLSVAMLVYKEKLVRCNCFGNSSEVLSWFDVLRNAIFVLITGALLVSSSSAPQSPDVKSLDQMVLILVALMCVQVLLNLKPIALLIFSSKQAEQ